MSVMGLGKYPKKEDIRTPNYSIIENYFIAELQYLHFRDFARKITASEDTKLEAAKRFGAAEAIGSLIVTFFHCLDEVTDENVDCFVKDREGKLTDYEIKYLHYVVYNFHAD